MTNSESQPMVSVIIPCYNQSHFLGEAISSVRNQRYPHYEVVVVDDGSTDDTAAVAASFDGVICIRQRNQGLGAARNAGFHHSHGAYIVFLDADDRLLRNGLESNAGFLSARPDVVFAYGPFAYIAENGQRLPGSPPCRPEGDDYSALLRGRNFIAMIATVMFRRATLENAGPFDASFPGCEDYELFLRCARQGILGRHEECIAEYRQHPAGYSRNNRLMLISGVAVIRCQWSYAKKNELYRQAYREGIESWRDHFGKKLLDDVRGRWKDGNRRRAIADLIVLCRYSPRLLIAAVKRRLW